VRDADHHVAAGGEVGQGLVRRLDVERRDVGRREQERTAVAVDRRRGRLDRGRLERAAGRDRRRPSPGPGPQRRLDARRRLGADELRQPRVACRERLDDDRGRISPS
jgi:hypothetical protein